MILDWAQMVKCSKDKKVLKMTDELRKGYMDRLMKYSKGVSNFTPSRLLHLSSSQTHKNSLQCKNIRLGSEIHRVK